MKRTILISALLLLAVSSVRAVSPYYRIASRSGDIEAVAAEYKTMIETNGFTFLGQYHPAANPGLMVIAFTCPQLKEIATGINDRGALGAIMKLGFVKKGGMVEVSMINPDWLFNGYFRDEMEKSRTAGDLKAISGKLTAVFLTGNEKPVPFGGELSEKDLRKYHYMMGMPYFSDPVELKTYSSFDEGVKAIRSNIEKLQGRVVKVFELYEPDKKVAVFGIGLPDAEKGEGRFLPIIGEENVAAMPYEIILQGNQASMLHGRFRFALHWPELKMSTFTKIMSSPGDVEDFMKLLVE